MSTTQDVNNEIVICYVCKKHLDFEPEQKISRQEECVYCRASLRCCRMCYFFSTNVYNECREPNAERTLDKERINFCSYFQLRSGDSDNETKLKETTSAADALFKN